MIIKDKKQKERLRRSLKIPTHMTIVERLLLFDLASKLSSEAIIVEVGSYLGASTCFLAEAVCVSRGIVYAVDPWTNLSMSEGERDTYELFLKYTAAYRDIIIPLRGLSIDIAADFNHTIDLLFIDGDHSYEGVRTDLENWLPKVKEGGWVVCHDYNWAKGVRQAVREFVAPLQITAGWQLDATYWTRISHQRLLKQSIAEVTVIIPTYQRQVYVLDALRSVIEQEETTFAFEVLVLDNGCDHDLQQSVEDIAQITSVPIRYIPVEELGLHNGRNLGAIAARGKIIVYIDDDVIVPPGWLEALCQPFNDPAVGGVGGKTLPKWEAAPPEWLKILDPSYFSLLDLGDSDRDMTFPETPYGCNMAYRRELILSLGGFAPDGVGGHWIEWQRGDGETGFAYKVYNEGYRIAYCAQAWLYHRIPAKRQTREFAYRRTIKAAVGSAYFYCRRVQLSRLRLCLQAVKYFLKMLLSSIKWLSTSLQPIEKRLSQELNTIYYIISTLYMLRAIIDPNLRRWIAKPDYWPTQIIAEKPSSSTC